MLFKTLYFSHSIYEIEKFINDEYNYFLLTPDLWSDYDYLTSLNLTIIYNNEIFEGYQIKMIFIDSNDREIETSTYEYLNKFTNSFSSVEILNDLNFISIIDDYFEISKILKTDFINYLYQLNDIVVLKYLVENKIEQYVYDSLDEVNNKILRFEKHNAFYKSILRDQSTKRAYYEGLEKILNDNKIPREKCKFKFGYKVKNESLLFEFYFSNEELPSRINLLIGKNGVGKTQTLEHIVNYLLSPEEFMDLENIVVDEHPNFISNLCVVSYNPYDNFYINKLSNNISIKYKYLGHRRYKTLNDGLSIENICNSNPNILEILSSDEATSLVNQLSVLNNYKNSHLYNKLSDILYKEGDYKESDFISSLVVNFDVINEIINDVKNFDKTSFNSIFDLCEKERIRSKFMETCLLEEMLEIISEHIEHIKYIGIKNKKDLNQKITFLEDFNSFKLENKNDYIEEISFYDENYKPIHHLSSGQKIFTSFIINIFSMIEENSLIIIDEPENTLHPNFEIEFIRILNNILEDFNSFAIIATHSLNIVREVPSNCVNVLLKDQKNNRVEVIKPNIQTFGANVTDLSNYIFDDLFLEDKPYEKWLNGKISEYIKNNKNFEDFIEDFENTLNYEMKNEAFEVFSRNVNV